MLQFLNLNEQSSGLIAPGATKLDEFLQLSFGGTEIVSP
jgi:hypothetical protein